MRMRAGWPFWPAAFACALVTGAMHIEKGHTALQILGLFAVTGIGGAFFSWLVERWDSLWFAWTVHALMNFWWAYFNVAPTALGGWFAFGMQLASVVAAIAVTHRMTPKPTRRSAGSPAERDEPPFHMRGAIAAG